MSLFRMPRVGVACTGAALLAAVAVAVPSSSAASTKSPIKIGVDLSLTGPFGPLGQSTEKGIELAAKQINATGGVAGRKIKLTILDDATNPATAISNTNTLISGGSAAIIGYNGGQTAVPAAGALARNHIFTVALSGYNPGQPYVKTMFFAPPTLSTHVEAISCYINKVIKAKKVGIIASNDAGSTVVGSSVATDLKNHGVSVVSQTVQAGATDVTAAATLIRQDNPDLIFDDAVATTGGLTAQTLRSLGVTTPIEGWLSWEQAAVLNIYKSSLNGIAMEGFFSPQHPLPYQVAFVKAFGKAYPSVQADAYAAWGYDSLEATADAFKSVPNATQHSGAALATAMQSISYRGVVGDWKLGKFNAKNPNTHTGMHLDDAVFYKIANGVMVPMKPQPKCT